MWRRKEVSTNKILVYYILAIVIPCIGLGILAFRGIRNDQALLERENLRSWKEIGEETSRHTNALLDSIERDFIHFLEVYDSSKNDSDNKNAILSFVQDNPVVKTVMFHSEKDGQTSIFDTLIYHSDDTPISLEIEPSFKATEALNEGWKYEFRDRDYSRAISHYIRSIREIKDPIDRSMLMNVMARIWRKKGDLVKATELYSQIINEYGDIYLRSSIPIGISARRELIKAYIEQERFDLVVEALSELILVLKEGQVPIKKAYFKNTLEDVDSFITKLDPIPSSIKKSYEALISAEHNTECLLQFVSYSEETISQNNIPITGSSRYSDQYNGSGYFYSLLERENNRWIILYDDSLCFNLTAAPFLDSKAHEMKFRWYRERDANMDWSDKIESDIITSLNFDFPDPFPNWSIQFFSEQSDTFSSLWKTSKGVYLYIFISILIILLFGLYFTLFTVNQELRLSRMKSFFISTVSHEFKSPITSLRQMAEMLDRNRIKDNERKKVYYSTMLHESERLSHLVENILDFARMEQGRKKYKFDLAQIETTISEAVNTFRLQTEGKIMHLGFQVVGDLPQIRFDREALEQVMHNLLDNAFKYGGAEKHIDVIVERSGPWIIIKVKDSGIGISKRDQSKIFNRFFRAGDELTGRVKGSGIGLTIVQQIIEDHKGKITVKSKPGAGSSFTISLPIKPSS